MTPVQVNEVPELEAVARRIRRSIIEIVYDAGGGHIGGALSQTDVLVALYYRYLNIDAVNPDDPQRDRLILSKGHGGLGLAAILADRGFFPGAELKHFGETGHRLGMHMEHGKVPGVETSTGSLGHGLGLAVGMALGARVQGQSWRTCCVLSDGECYEGSTWEALISAAGFGLGNLLIVVDRNRMTMDGRTEDEMPLEPLAARFEAFGCRVWTVDGHDLDALCGAVEAALSPADCPAVLIAETTKGKGVPFMEDDARWHYGALDSEMYQKALDAISEGA